MKDVFDFQVYLCIQVLEQKMRKGISLEFNFGPVGGGGFQIVSVS